MAIRSYNLNRSIGIFPKLLLVVQDLADTWQPATEYLALGGQNHPWPYPLKQQYLAR